MVSTWADRHIKWFFILPATLFVVLMMIFPIIYTVRLSFFRWSGAAQQEPIWVGISNYAELFGSDPRFWPAVWRTFAFTIGAVALELVLGVAIALLLNGKYRGQGFIKTIILLPMVATPVAIAMAWLLILEPTIGFANMALRSLGLPPQLWIAAPSQALFSLILVDVWQWTPLIILIVLAALATLPEEPFEAAIVDGANAWQRFWRITLPLLSPALVTAVLLRSIDALKTFDIIYVMTRGGPGFATETLNIYTYVRSFEYFQFGQASSLLVIFFTIILGVSLLLTQVRNRWGATT